MNVLSLISPSWSVWDFSPKGEWIHLCKIVTQHMINNNEKFGTQEERWNHLQWFVCEDGNQSDHSDRENNEDPGRKEGKSSVQGKNHGSQVFATLHAISSWKFLFTFSVFVYTHVSVCIFVHVYMHMCVHLYTHIKYKGVYLCLC